MRPRRRPLGGERHHRPVTETAATESYPRQRARTRGFRLGAPRAFTVADDGRQILFLRSRGGADATTCLWSLDLTTGAETCIVDPRDLLDDAESLPDEERARRERLREVNAGITEYSLDHDGRVAVFALSGTPYAVDISAAGTARALPAPGPVIDPRMDPTGQRAAYVCNRGLYVVNVNGGEPQLLCAPDSDDVSWGLADFIAAEELDRVRGYWWLADGSGLLVERSDDSPVSTWWVADPAQPELPARRIDRDRLDRAILGATHDLESGAKPVDALMVVARRGDRPRLDSRRA